MSITLVLIAITVVISLLAWQQPRLLDALIFWPPGVAKGQWWRLLSHGFIHADGAHLLFNMVTLYFFGTVMERVLTPRIGSMGFVFFYLAGILIAILPSHFRHRRDANYRSLGASGAVAAMLFAYILLQPWSLLLVFFVPVPAIVFAAAYVAYSIWAQRRGSDNINHSAHLWGGAWGVVFLVWLEPRLVARFMNELLAPLGT
ncbi:rhomboid family intramembrane serine protease [Litchfieldella qijiaojingensis]|uniref:Rhomboid family intramembrane serine protease n=1 Tax=Litchfieldella qijiaojingensis TaxID=980347 RepID=A0ABQ2YPK0_9GAMM|nr:rhomboid family intramembrane serine protease [Halomonas qijiaojingensis]GGX89696.1 rhomboid family intramembrane serine protease [Halomonas qijiaojingensis]